MPPRSYLVFELSDLPLAGRVVLYVVQHDLSVRQQGFGSLQVFPQALLRLNVAASHLTSRVKGKSESNQDQTISVRNENEIVKFATLQNFKC